MIVDCAGAQLSLAASLHVCLVPYVAAFGDLVTKSQVQSYACRIRQMVDDAKCTDGNLSWST